MASRHPDIPASRHPGIPASRHPAIPASRHPGIPASFIKKILLFLPAMGLVLNSGGQTTRYWIGGGSANFTDGTHWSLSSGGPAIGGTIVWGISDIARFDNNSGSPVVTFTASEDVGKLQVSGTITVTFKPNATAGRTLDINSVASDALTVAAGSTLVISGLDAASDRDMHVALHSTPGVTASISGTVKVTDEATGYGGFSKGTDASVYFNSGSTFHYNSDASANSIPVSNWNANSTLYVTGVKTNKPGNPAQSFGHYTWECAGQTDLVDLTDGSNNAPYIQGNFWLKNTGSSGVYLSLSADVSMSILGNYTQSGGNFYVAQSSGNDIIYLGGNFSLSSGYISCPGTGSCTFNFNTSATHTYSKTGGNYYGKIHFTVVAGTLDMGTSVIDAGSSGNFTLNSGCGLKTAHAQGIASSGATGCVQLTGSRSYSTAANYTFYASGAQSTGSGFTSSPTGILTTGSTANATVLTLTNTPVTVSNRLILVSNGTTNSSITSGTVAYGSSAVLEYQGASAQASTVKEWPVSSAPNHVTINNPNGVSLHDDRTIGGTFTLTLGNFSIGAHTLTLNGTLTRTSGGLTGGSSSDIMIGGASGSPLDLPAVTLGNLTLNRPGGMRLLGNVTVNGTMTMTNGAVTLNGFALAYGVTATLKYNGTSAQTTADPEFPATGGPFHLYNDNAAGLNLHSTRTIGGDLTLNKGTFAIGANTFNLGGIISKNTGTMTGGSSSNLVFAPGASAASLWEITLNDLTVNRTAGVSMNGTVTIGGTLYLTSGNLSIGGNTLNMNGSISYGSQLTGGSSSILNVGGTAGQLGLAPVTLSTLTLNRSSGLSLTGDISVLGTFNLVRGAVSRNGFALYGPSATLRYAGSLPQTTTSEELPSSGGPFNLMADNPSGVSLHASRGIPGNLQLSSGAFSIGANTLSLSGMIVPGSGSLNGGAASNITIEGTAGPTGLPSVTLNTLTLNRAAGIWLDGHVTVQQDLVLGSGNLSVGSRILTLNGNAISGNPAFLQANAASTLVFGGTVPGIPIPGHLTDLSGLEVYNASRVILQGPVLVWGMVIVGGWLDCTDKKISGPGGFIMQAGARLTTAHPMGVSGSIAVAGPKMIDAVTDYEFNGITGQETHFLPTAPPNTIRHLVISNSSGATVTLTESMTLTGNLDVKVTSDFTVDPAVTLEVGGEVVIW